MINTPNPSRWSELFHQAMLILDQLKNRHGYSLDFSFGGGTALMLRILHRESHDIDLFFEDPQFLPLLNPDTQEYRLPIKPTDYEVDGSRSLKITFRNIGEIDFICCQPVTKKHSQPFTIDHRTVALETPSEIIAKKLYYRSARIQPRDVFDIAATIRCLGADELIRQLIPIADKCREALATLERQDKDFAVKVMRQLMIKDGYQDLPDHARKEASDFLQKVIAASNT